MKQAESEWSTVLSKKKLFMWLILGPTAPTTNLVFPSINLKKGDGALAVNFIAWRVPKVTFGLRTKGGSGGDCCGHTGRQASQDHSYQVAL